jgi:hypothetical protein
MHATTVITSITAFRCCFAVLKRLNRQEIQEFMRNGVNYIDKQDFLTVYYSAS